MVESDTPITNINDIAAAAAKEEQEIIAREKAAKAQLAAAMKEDTVKEIDKEITKMASEPTKTKEGFSVVKSEPFLEDSKDEDDPLKDELKKRAEEKKDSIFKRTKKKVAIKLGKIAFVIADAERFAYEKFHLNAPLMTQEEIDADYIETYEDTKEVIDNRVGIESENGDIWNLGITVGAHFAKRGFRYYTGGRKRVDNSFRDQGASEEQEGEEERRFSSVGEEAAYLAERAEREGRSLAP